MGEPTVPLGYTVVLRDDWPDHPWLSKLIWGSDADYESADFFTWADAPAPIAALDRIVMQRLTAGSWNDALRCDGCVYPSRDWASAAVGWYDSLGFFGTSGRGDGSRALIPDGWDCARIPPQNQVPDVDYFTDWRTREWTCACGWTGNNLTALVFAAAAVSIACPACGRGMATVSCEPGDEQIRTAAGAGIPEALALLDPDEYGDPFIGGKGRRRFVTGHEDAVLFGGGDQFFGVTAAWLLPRLRLDPAQLEVDLFEGHLAVVLDNELYEDIDTESVLGGPTSELCSYGDGGNIGGRYDLAGGWLQDWAWELRHSLTWVGHDVQDLRDFALAQIAAGLTDWSPQEHERFEATSPYLDATLADDCAAVLDLAGEAGEVWLNEQRLRPVSR